MVGNISFASPESEVAATNVKALAEESEEVYKLVHDMSEGFDVLDFLTITKD